MTPSPRSPPPNPLLDTKPGRLGSPEDEAEDGVAVEEQVLPAEEEEAEEEAAAAEGRPREGAGSGGFTSVVKHGPNRFRQLPFFFFFTPSSIPPPPGAAPPIPGPALDGRGRL